jgi:hypothetical protein
MPAPTIIYKSNSPLPPTDRPKTPKTTERATGGIVLLVDGCMKVRDEEDEGKDEEDEWSMYS